MGKRRIFGQQKHTHPKLKAFCLVATVIFCLALAHCYYRLPDSMAAVTFWPAWLWAIPGLFLTIFGASNKTKRPTIAIVLMWLIFLGVFCEEPRALIPHKPVQGFEAAQKSGKAFRLISLNCAGGTANAAEELAQYKPDIVLLQESPDCQEVKGYAYKLFGKDATIVYGIDVSIIARGKTTPALPYRQRKSFYTSARIKLKSGAVVDVTNIRLSPPPVPWRLLKPVCWSKQAEIRKEHQGQLEMVMKHVKSVPNSVPAIVGGDLNAPAFDGAQRIMKPLLHDSYREAGRGLGNTITNDLSVCRYDQVWLSSNLHALQSVTRRTLHSDHRAVICDIMVRGTK